MSTSIAESPALDTEEAATESVHEGASGELGDVNMIIEVTTVDASSTDPPTGTQCNVEDIDDRSEGPTGATKIVSTSLMPTTCGACHIDLMLS